MMTAEQKSDEAGTLVWMSCPDGRQTARTSSFRVGWRMIEVGGFYMIAG
jgi:hypothetical protein